MFEAETLESQQNLTQAQLFVEEVIDRMQQMMSELEDQNPKATRFPTVDEFIPYMNLKNKVRDLENYASNDTLSRAYCTTLLEDLKNKDEADLTEEDRLEIEKLESILNQE
jgi:hypothetical protein